MKSFTSKFHLPIVFKLVFLTSLLVVTVALVIAWKNSELFSQISTDREETTAEMMTSSKALEVEAILESYIEKLTTLASVSGERPSNGDVVFFKVFSTNSQNSEMTEETNEFARLLESYKSQEAQIQNGDIYLTSTGNKLSEPYLLIGTPVAKANGVVTHWAWGFFKINRLQSSFEKNNDLVLYLIDEEGKVLVHQDEKKTVENTDLSSNKFVKAVLKIDIRKKQQYIDQTLHSMAKTRLGPIVLADMPQASIVAPSLLAKETSYFILGMILSLSFFFSVVFAQTLSANIEKLTQFAYRIADGDFNVEASKSIRSKDEIGILAVAFDDMTEGLRERDKIKNIFTKFHGSVITNTLMDQEDLRKGKQCEAVVFFSDIRGFTDFSNNKSPEEVVAMLNSYFEVMVGIINKHGGVVDKFVGDAIMAVWGAPQGTSDDAKNALTACLEMRKALATFNEKRIADGQIPIMMGMGLHAGPVVAGTIGSDDRLEYTVIGDTVNTASRIESSTKAFGTDLLVSEEVLNRVGDNFLTTFAGSTKVKGKTEALKLSKVTGDIDEAGNPRIISTPYSQYEAEEADKVKILAS